MKWLFLSVVLLSTFAAENTASAEINEPTYELRTRYGLLKVSQSQEEGPFDIITLDGKPVLHVAGNNNFLSFRGYFNTGDSDVALVAAGCSCSSGEPEELSFLIVGANSMTKIITNPRFFSSDLTVKPIPTSGKAVVDLGHEAGKRKVAELDGQTITIRMTTERAKLPASDCGALYERLQECKKVAGSTDPCALIAQRGWFSNALMNALRAYSQNPAFNYEQWNRICAAACEENRPTYAIFQESVCRTEHAQQGASANAPKAAHP